MNQKNYASSREILELLGNGVLIVIALTSPTGGAEIIKRFVFKSLDKIWEKYDRSKLKQSVRRMVDRKLVELRQEGEETVVVISEKGRRFLLKYDFEEMQLEKPKVWDRKWRVVIFDIKEDKKSMRDSLRRKMIHLGFYPLQKSVFVTPYHCENEIAFLRQYLGVGNEVSYFTTSDLEEEEFLKKEFKLD